MEYIKKLKDLDGQRFTIKKIFPGQYEYWDDIARRTAYKETITPSERQELNSMGFNKYAFKIPMIVTLGDSDVEWRFSFSNGQVKEMKLKCKAADNNELIGNTLEVIWNGQTGKETRYMFKFIDGIKGTGESEVDIEEFFNDKNSK